MILKKMLKDTKAQISLEALLIVSILVLAALLTGYYLKQTAYANSKKVTEIQKETMKGSQ